ncbi:MAG: tyrosine-protein phosphatase [Congregibacter sp.]
MPPDDPFPVGLFVYHKLDALFMVSSDQQSRVVGLSGSPNFRDAGGYASRHGSRMHWGKVYRSGHLATLSEADQARFAQLEIELICDLRRPDEQAHEPSLIPSDVKVLSAPITPGSQRSAIYDDSTQIRGAAAMVEFMCNINREFVRSQSDSYRQVFAELLESGATRVLFHCSAGKDRTGFAVAMLQMALGVADNDIEADYLLSRHYYRAEEQLPRVREKYPVDHLSDEDLAPMMLSDIRYLHSALETIDALHGSREDYLAVELGLGAQEREELRRRFLA